MGPILGCFLSNRLRRNSIFLGTRTEGNYGVLFWWGIWGHFCFDFKIQVDLLLVIFLGGLAVVFLFFGAQN